MSFLSEAINGATREVIDRAEKDAITAAAMSDDRRVQSADAVAVARAAHVGALASAVTVLEHLERFNTNCERCADLDQEIRDLLTVAREVSMTDRSMVADQLAAAARDAAIADPFHDEPDDRPSADELAADEHDARLAESEVDR